ncbi:MAG TPA: hypothetical protein VIH43_04565 [Chthoniobacterales bacterium]
MTSWLCGKPTRSIRLLRLAAILILGPVCSYAQQGRLKLNQNGFIYASELIARRDFTVDKNDAWRDHHPTSQEQNEFIRSRGFEEYGKWHLGIDATHPEDTKIRYKFPFGDFKKIHRCALLAVKSRARQYGYADIEKAAVRLLDMINSAGR